MGTESQEDRFRPSDDTTRRWRQRQRASLRLIAPAAVAVVAAVAIRGTAVAAPFGVGLGGAAVVYLIVGSYVWYRKSPARWAPGADWVGAVTFRVPDIARAGLSSRLEEFRARSPEHWRRGLDTVMGLLELRADGITWNVGRFARLRGFRGTVRIAWTELERIDVGDVPGAIRGVGGGITLHLKNGQQLDGSFLGSREHLITALTRSPLAHA